MSRPEDIHRCHAVNDGQGGVLVYVGEPERLLMGISFNWLRSMLSLEHSPDKRVVVYVEYDDRQFYSYDEIGQHAGAD